MAGASGVPCGGRQLGEPRRRAMLGAGLPRRIRLARGDAADDAARRARHHAAVSRRDSCGGRLGDPSGSPLGGGPHRKGARDARIQLLRTAHGVEVLPGRGRIRWPAPCRARAADDGDADGRWRRRAGRVASRGSGRHAGPPRGRVRRRPLDTRHGKRDGRRRGCPVARRDGGRREAPAQRHSLVRLLSRQRDRAPDVRAVEARWGHAAAGQRTRQRTH